MSSLYTLGTEVTLFYDFTVNDVPTDPTTVTFTIELPDGTTVTFADSDPEVSNPVVGRYECSYDPPLIGTYQYKIAGTGTVIATSPPGTFIVTGDAISSGWSVIGGPCEPWVSSYAVAECCGATAPDYQMLERAAHAATELLYPLSGSQFSGDCTSTFRPCGKSSCSGPWGAWSGSYWTGDIAASAHRGCSCSPLDRIPLAGHARRIVEVTIDGLVVDPTTYRLDEGMWLTRVNDPLDPLVPLYWPSCEDARRPLSEEGTFGITYVYGRPVPVAGLLAAKELACAVYVTCTTSDPESCPLPNGVTQIIRQGITINLNGFATWGLKEGTWQTGLPLVDAFLNAVNPRGVRKGRAQVWSPDLWKYPRRVGTTADPLGT